MKKIIKIGFLTALSVLMCSCYDIFSVDTPVLNISFDDQDRVDVDGVLHAYTNDVIIVNMSGDADIIFQYSGVEGQEYIAPGNYDTTGGTLTVQFATTLSWSGSSYQQECLNLYISKDFTGVRDSMNINNATWIQIPYDDVGFAVSSTSTTSNVIDILPYLPEDERESGSVYFAFRYKSDPPTISFNSTTGDTSSAYYYGQKWIVSTFDVQRTYADGSYNYYGLSNNSLTGKLVFAGFTDGVDWSLPNSYHYYDSSNTWTCVAASCTFTPNQTNRFYQVCDDDWLISYDYDLTREPEADAAVAIKGTTTAMPETTTFSYTDPGLYTITIIARNMTIRDEDEIVRQLKVLVTDPNAV